MYTERKDCRLCNGKLWEVISLGDIHISSFVDTNDDPTTKVPITLMECLDCGLMQLLHTVDPEVMYSDYWYQSGLNNSMVIALRDIVKEIQKRVDLQPKDIVVDIGANDGTMLSFYPSEITTVAFEPSDIADLAYTKATVTINNFFNAADYNYILSKKAKVITAIAMFYDLEDPHKFLDDVKAILADNGIFVIQMMDFMSMVKYNDFPNLCHEHLEYYTLRVLKNLLEQHGLEIFDVEFNGINGGSMRVYVRHDSTKIESYAMILPVIDQGYINVVNALAEEADFFNARGDIGPYFRKHIEKIREKVLDFIFTMKDTGFKVAVLGASTKGNTVLQYFGLTDKEIDHAAEINKDKFGKRTVGSNIPIISQEESLKQNPDVYFVLPWSFIDNFEVKLDTYLKNGGTLLVHLPEPRLIFMDVKGNRIEWNL